MQSRWMLTPLFHSFLIVYHTFLLLHSLYSAASGHSSLPGERFKKPKLKSVIGLMASAVSTADSQVLDVMFAERWFSQENLHDVQTLMCTLLLPVDFLLDSLICCPYYSTQKLPLPRVLSSPSPSDVWEEVHKDASSQVTSFAHLTCDKHTSSQPRLVVMKACSTATCSPILP